MTLVNNKPLKKVLCTLTLVLAIGLVVACKKEGAAQEPRLAVETVSGTWRYKLTVNVETPEGIKSGYAVRELSNSWSKLTLNLPEATNPIEVTGEAIVVDLGSRGKIFALLRGYTLGENHAGSVLHYVFPIPPDMDGKAKDVRYYKDLKAGPKALTFGLYPVMVTFKDINDPKTVTKVMDIERDRSKGWVEAEDRIKADHFEELFGKGVKLKEITIEMTDEPVTWGRVDQYLSQDFWSSYRTWIGLMDISERGKYIPLFDLKKGE